MDARLGQHIFMRPVVSVAAGDTAVMGAQALAHFAATFDQRRRVLRLARTETDPIRSPRVRTAGLGLTWEPRGPVVTDIIPGTPAARLDIQQGDRLLAVDGQAVEGLSHGAFEQMVEKSELVLVLDRDGRRIEVRVPVVDLVP
jgi:S1-C subfamily serine protease